MEYKRVTPHSFEGKSLSWNLNLFSGPKFTIECGNCRKMFTARLPLMDSPAVECPRCHVDNVMPIEYGG